ncbi:MAG: sigma-70 family RNA polymerase sigma factor [Myxococcaceae bacterium]|nr:sigma-70 family RNA polymerase sigma factor [Myxococcaceae bacterium]
MPTPAPADQALQEARAAWPSVTLDGKAFKARWSSLLDPDDPEAPAPLGPDLYLAMACLANDAPAQAELRKMIVGQLQQLAHFRFSREDQEELAQHTLTALLVGGAKGKKLAQYAARGPIQGWLRVLLTRAALDRVQRNRAAPPADEEVLLGLPGPDRDAELESLKAKYKGQFSEVFRFAIQSLTPRQRNLLRQHYLDDLSLEELGALYQVHRATAARWLLEARQQVMTTTRDEIGRRTGIPRMEVDSLMRVVQSRLDLSAGFFLTPPKGAEPK